MVSDWAWALLGVSVVRVIARRAKARRGNTAIKRGQNQTCLNYAACEQGKAAWRINLKNTLFHIFGERQNDWNLYTKDVIEVRDPNPRLTAQWSDAFV